MYLDCAVVAVVAVAVAVVVVVVVVVARAVIPSAARNLPPSGYPSAVGAGGDWLRRTPLPRCARNDGAKREAVQKKTVGTVERAGTAGMAV
jgi:hypothetical protein